MATAEFAPFAKTGGLADVASGLSRYLADIGQDVRVFLPLYGSIDRAGLSGVPIEHLQGMTMEFGGERVRFSVHAIGVPGTPHSINMIDCPRFFGREGIYCQDGDEHLRFGFFSRAILQACQHQGWAPHIIHCNDWHTGLIPLYLRSLYEWDDLFRDTRSIMTIHNLGYQGVFSSDSLHALGLDDHRSLLWHEDLERGVVNFLKMGIVYADVVTTVSRTYAHEIQDEEQGYGLHQILRDRSDHLVGIVNGVDYGHWDPSGDTLIPARYTSGDLSGKATCKAALLERMGLKAGERAPTFGMVSRLTYQKGIELLYDTLPELLGGTDARVVVLGSGEHDYEGFFHHLQHTFPGKMCFYCGYNNELAHLIEAGADMFLMPSRFEPCGLNQLYSLRYGTVPIVRATGGLADTVQHWSGAPEHRGTGFVFEHFTPDGVRWAIGEALKAYADRTGWEVLMRNGMRQDYSWQRQGRAYLSLYSKLAGL